MITSNAVRRSCLVVRPAIGTRWCRPPVTSLAVSSISTSSSSCPQTGWTSDIWPCLSCAYVIHVFSFPQNTALEPKVHCVCTSILFISVLNGFSPVHHLKISAQTFAHISCVVKVPTLCDLVTLIMSDENHRSLSSALCNFLNSCVSSTVYDWFLCPRNGCRRFLQMLVIFYHTT